MPRRLLPVMLVTAGLGALALVGPAPADATSSAATTSAVPGVAVIQPDAEVLFDSGGVPIHASLRAPGPDAAGVPAAVIIGGSGDLDRNGNGPALPVDLDPYLWIADLLSEQGVASIRYDKLGSGATGLGPYEADPDALLDKTYDELRIQPARDALAFLAAQPGVDPSRVFVIGHSEGGMDALALDRRPGNAPRPAGLALIEPQYAPILSVIDRQLSETADQLVQAGLLDPADAAVLVDWLRAGIAEIRTGTPPYPTPGPDPLPGATGAAAQLQAGIRASVYNSDPRLMLQTQAMRNLYGKLDDQLDPVVLARSVSVPTLITCGTRDDDTPCQIGGAPGSGVAPLAAAFAPGIADLVVAPGTVHFLRDVGDANPTMAELAGYPYSTAIEDALRSYASSFVAPPVPVPVTPVVVSPTFTG